MKQRGAKPGALGAAFHTWLEWLEYCEQLLLGTGKVRGKKLHYMAMNDTLFKCNTDAEFNQMMHDVVPVDAYMARIVRSSTKYKVDAHVLMDMAVKYNDELNYIRETRPLNLPFEWCTLVITGFGPDEFVVAMQETDPRDGKSYPELGVESGEKFIDGSIVFYRQKGVELIGGFVAKGQQLSFCPVELHFNKNKLEADTTFLNAVAEGVTVTPAGTTAVELVRNMVLVWIHSFHLSSILRSRQVGLPATPGKTFTRKRLRKKKQHPHFEHFIVEMEVDEPASQQAGHSGWQSRKRLHQVRGFFRHYKSGKVSWVNSHWRGEERLGVVRKDYEMKLHDDGPDDGPCASES